jgi:hypothetical protein
LKFAGRLAALARAVSARRPPQAGAWRVVFYDPDREPPTVDFGPDVRAVLYLPDNGRDLPPAGGDRS